MKCLGFFIRMYWDVNQSVLHKDVCNISDSVLSGKFSVSNGIKQGGIMSPVWFNMYVSVLSMMKFNETYIGWWFNMYVSALSMKLNETYIGWCLNDYVADAWSAPSHYLNQCWHIVNWTIGNKLQWNLNRNSHIFTQEKAFENVVWKMEAILSRLQCVNSDLRHHKKLTVFHPAR